jgi:PAS domain S-box-containing protein
MSGNRGATGRRDAVQTPKRSAARALEGVAAKGTRVLLVGFGQLDDDCWAVLIQSGLCLDRRLDVGGALEALADGGAPVVITEVRWARPLISAIRDRTDLASVHVVVGAALDSSTELRQALDAGADDVIRVPFEPEVLAARVAAGLRAARLREDEALWHSLVENIPGALYRCACDPGWTMEWLSDEIEVISGYPATDFIESSARTFASVIDPEDRERVRRSIMQAVDECRPFSLEYRIRRRDGAARWVLDRGQAVESGDGRRWLDGAIFDVTVRRNAEEAMREREIVKAQLAEVRASRARVVEAADRARREIERNLHDGAQQRFLSVMLQLRRLIDHGELSAPARQDLGTLLDELRAGYDELHDLARGLHPAALAEGGLERALTSLTQHAEVPTELRVSLAGPRLVAPLEATAYFTVAEALTNVAKYSGATRAWVAVEERERCLRIEIGDDGSGGARLRPGSGLQGLSDRVAAANGTFTIESPPGVGTVLRARLPVD